MYGWSLLPFARLARQALQTNVERHSSLRLHAFGSREQRCRKVDQVVLVNLFSDLLRPGTKDVILRCNREEMCRVIGLRTQVRTTKDIPAYEADVLGERLESLWSTVKGFARVHPEQKVLGCRQTCVLR